MKSPEQCIKFINDIINNNKECPTDEEWDFYDSIKFYLVWCAKEYPYRETTYRGKPLTYAEDGFISTYCKPNEPMSHDALVALLDEIESDVFGGANNV